MFPTITVFGRTFGLYWIMALIGGFAAGIYACRLATKRRQDDNEMIIVLLISAIGVLLGGHLLYGITNLSGIPSIFQSGSFREFLDRFSSVFGGSVFYGGLIGAIIAATVTIRARKLPMKIFSDILATIIPLFHSFARVGCFLGGCCYGIECEFGFTAHGNTLVPELNGVSRFPVQLLEAGLNLLLFFFLRWVYQKSLEQPKLQGKILPVYLLCYSVIRFFDEFLRGDLIRGFVFGMSTSQFISILLFAVSAVALCVLHSREKAGRQ